MRLAPTNKGTMANEQNLISLGDRTTREQREIAQRGGVASGVARRERKRASEVARAILDSTITLDDGTEATTLLAMMRKQVNLALNGDTKAFLCLLKVADELPRGKQENEQPPAPVSIVSSSKAIEAMKALDEVGNGVYIGLDKNGNLTYTRADGSHL